MAPESDWDDSTTSTLDAVERLAGVHAEAVDHAHDESGALAELGGEGRIGARGGLGHDAESVEVEVLQRGVAPDLVTGGRESGHLEGVPRQLARGRVGALGNEGGG